MKRLVPVPLGVVLLVVGLAGAACSGTASPAAGSTTSSLNDGQTNTTSAPAERFAGRYIDVHTHIMPKGMSLEEIVASMDSEGIDTMIVMPTPTAIHEGITQTDASSAAEYPSRFIALYGGKAITLLDSVVDKGSYTQSQEKSYVGLLKEAMKSGEYRGFGEIALRHVAVGEKDADVTVPGDHPWMFIMSDVAAQYDVPIDIHMDIVPGEESGIAGLEKLLDHNRKTKIIWSHTAWSRTDYETSISADEMRQLFEKHPNLYSSIKIQTETAFMIEQPQAGTSATTKPKGSGGGGSAKDQKPVSVIDPDWLALFEEYPDRFMIGSDIKPGAGGDEFKFVVRHIKFLEQLPLGILKQFERDNAIEIFNIGQGA